MIVRTPPPSSPTSQAEAASNSISLEALERLPSLSLSRCRRKRLRSPSGVQRGKRKQEMPPSAWARTRKASHIGADMNHLWPVSSYSAPGPPPSAGGARAGGGGGGGAAAGPGRRGRRVGGVVGGGGRAPLPLRPPPPRAAPPPGGGGGGGGGAGRSR